MFLGFGVLYFRDVEFDYVLIFDKNNLYLICIKKL